jgi:hypothetical protein
MLQAEEVEPLQQTTLVRARAGRHLRSQCLNKRYAAETQSRFTKLRKPGTSPGNRVQSTLLRIWVKAERFAPSK